MNNLYPIIAYIFAVSYTPGPNNIMSMVNGMRYGYTKMLRFLVGVVSGFLIVATGGAMVNLFLANYIPDSEIWLKILSAVYMLYLAYHVIRSGPIDDGNEKSAINKFWFGFTMQFMNVKSILFVISVFSMFMSDVSRESGMVLLFVLILGFNTFVATSSWALGGTLFRSLAQKHYRIFNYVMGGLLIYTAIAGLL